jgi:trehalose 6-phosphate synthase
VRVRAYPISVDVEGLKTVTASERFRHYEEQMKPLLGEQTIVRVDRMEPSKNIIRGFQAYDTLLQRYPEFIGKVKFLAFLVPSRTHLGPYQRYSKDTLNLIDTINEKYCTGDWRPIEFFYENNFVQALAGMAHYDVLLVNAVIDGMNLVAKEGPSVNKRDGVLVLSETVGASEQLGEYALTVTPTDLEGTVRALHSALTMPQKERRQRSQALAKSVAEEDLHNWVVRLIGDITELATPAPATS